MKTIKIISFKDYGLRNDGCFHWLVVVDCIIHSSHRTLTEARIIKKRLLGVQ